MGTPADPDEPDYEKGGECEICSDAIFNGHTPKFVQAVFEGVEACPPHDDFGVDGSYLLEQRGAFPCQWQKFLQVGMEEWEILYIATGAGGGWQSTLTIIVLQASLFDGRSTAKCVTSFGNRGACGLGDFTSGGTGAIRWGPDIE